MMSILISGRLTVISGWSTMPSGRSTLISGWSTMQSGRFTVISGSYNMIRWRSPGMSRSSMVISGRSTVKRDISTDPTHLKTEYKKARPTTPQKYCIVQEFNVSHKVKVMVFLIIRAVSLANKFINQGKNYPTIKEYIMKLNAYSIHLSLVQFGSFSQSLEVIRNIEDQIWFSRRLKEVKVENIYSSVLRSSLQL